MQDGGGEGDGPVQPRHLPVREDEHHPLHVARLLNLQVLPHEDLGAIHARETGQVKGQHDI